MSTTHPIIALAQGASHGLPLEERAELFEAAGKDLGSCAVGRLATEIAERIRLHSAALVVHEGLRKQLEETGRLLEEAEASFIEMASNALNIPPPLS